MTHKEKYPNTDDALKAFNEDRLAQLVGMPFEVWLKTEAPEHEDAPKGSTGHFLGKVVENLIDNIVTKKCDCPQCRAKREKRKRIIENLPPCPFCGKKITDFRTTFAPVFHCDECGAVVSFHDVEDADEAVKRFTRREQAVAEPERHNEDNAATTGNRPKGE